MVSWYSERSLYNDWMCWLNGELAQGLELILELNSTPIGA